MEKFKQDLIGENVLNLFLKTTKIFKKLDEVSDAEEILKMKKMHLNHGRRWFS